MTFLSVKSVGLLPVRVALVTVTATDPVFARVIVCAAPVVAAACVGKPMESGLMLAVGAAVAVPLKVAETVPAAVTTVRVSVRVPATVGAKAMLNVQLPPAATAVPQVVALTA